MCGWRRGEALGNRRVAGYLTGSLAYVALGGAEHGAGRERWRRTPFGACSGRARRLKG